MGVSRNEVRSVGVTPLSVQPSVGHYDGATDLDADGGDDQLLQRRKEFSRRHEERAQRMADSFAETRELLKKCDDLFRPVAAAVPQRAKDKPKSKRKKK